MKAFAMFLAALVVAGVAAQEEETQHWVFEYLNALFKGLDADYYVPGSGYCAFNF